MKDYVSMYIDQIENKKVVVGKKIRQFYLNIVKPIVEDNHPKYRYDASKGAFFIEFAERFCKQSKGKWRGKRVRMMLWQKAMFQTLLGVVDRETGKRRFNEAFIAVGRKNGKSWILSAFGIFLLLRTKGAEIYVAATTHAQASRIWEESRWIIENETILNKRFTSKVFPQKQTESKTSGSSFKVLSGNTKTQDGLNVAYAIIDEVHELSRKTYDVLKQGMSAAIDEPIMLMITTAGFVREGLFDDTYNYAKQVLDGTIEGDSFMPVIYELDNEQEINDEEMWIKANPAIDVIKQRDFLRDMVAKMKVDMNLANTVKVKDFNLIGVENNAWLSYEDFVNEEVYSEQELRKFDNTMVLGGFDLSRTGDLTAFNTLLFDREKKKIIAITQYWITAKFLDDQKNMDSKIPFQAWIDRGLIRISGQELIDYHDIANYVAHNFQKYGWMYANIYYDSYSAQYLVNELESLGYAKDHCLIAARQGYKTLSSPMQLLEAHLKNKTLVYQNNPVTRWCLSNVELEQDRNGNMMPSKRSDKRTRKIDGFSVILNTYIGVEKNLNYYLE
jgi:phage terminase large subunit-like protein